MIIDCISDLHGFFPKLEGGDLLIIAGDLTARDTFVQHAEFNKWLYEQDYLKKIVISGNHDNHFVGISSDHFIFSSYNTKISEQISYAEYLCDSGIEFSGLKIFGSPWSKTFKGMNPSCKAFTVDTEEELAIKFSLIPEDIDILITHTPPYGVLDGIPLEDGTDYHTGSTVLLEVLDRVKPKLHIFGHIHEQGGKKVLYKHQGPNTICVNASYVNERYKPVNQLVRIII